MSFKRPSDLDNITIQKVIGTTKNPIFDPDRFSELSIENQRYLLDRVSSRVRMRLKNIYDTDKAHNAKGKYIDVPSIRALEYRLREFAGKPADKDYAELTKSMRLSIKGATKSMSTDDMVFLMDKYTNALNHKTFSGKAAKEYTERVGEYIDKKRVLEGIDASLQGLMEMIFKELQDKFPYEKSLSYKALETGVIQNAVQTSFEELRNGTERKHIEELTDKVVEEMRALGY